jgi:hypothetical protein
MASLNPIVLRWVDGPILEFQSQLDLSRSTTKRTRNARLFGLTFGNVLNDSGELKLEVRHLPVWRNGGVLRAGIIGRPREKINV